MITAVDFINEISAGSNINFDKCIGDKFDHLVKVYGIIKNEHVTASVGYMHGKKMAIPLEYSNKKVAEKHFKALQHADIEVEKSADKELICYI